MIRNLSGGKGRGAMLLAQDNREPENTRKSRVKYSPPTDVHEITRDDLLHGSSAWKRHYQQNLDFGDGRSKSGAIYYAGDVTLIGRGCVSIVGTRRVSREGAARARRLARGLTDASIVVMSGLASGVDREAHVAAIENGGKTIAILGTPLDKSSPIANAPIQEAIYRDHLLISEFASGTKVWPSNFPQRNRLMAALSSATVIIEASDSSGTLHQAAECMRLNRWLFISESVAKDTTLEWPKKFLEYETCLPLTSVADITSRIV